MKGVFKSTINIEYTPILGGATTQYTGTVQGEYDSSKSSEQHFYSFTDTSLNNEIYLTIGVLLDSNGTHCSSASTNILFKTRGTHESIYSSGNVSFSGTSSNLNIFNNTEKTLTSVATIKYLSVNTLICCCECGKNNNEVYDSSLPLLTLTLSTNKQTITCSEKATATPTITCKIYNEGNTTFTNLSAVLSDGVGLSSTLTTILPGETLTVTKTYGTGDITKTTDFTVIVTGTTNGLVKTYTSNSVTIDVLSCTPELTVSKTADKTVLHLEDETVQFKITIENTGNADLYNLTLKDNGVDMSTHLIAASNDDDHFKWAAGGAWKPIEGITKQAPLRHGDFITIVYEEDYTGLTCKEIKCKYKEATTKINSAVVTAKYVDNTDTEKTITASNTYSLAVMIPALDIDYTVAKTYANNKITLTYTLTVENTGCVDLEEITFTDTVVNTNTYTDCSALDENQIEKSNNEDYLELSITKKAYNYDTDTEVTSITAGTKIYYVYTITNSNLSTVSAQVDSISDDLIDLSEVTVPFTIANGVTQTISTISTKKFTPKVYTVELDLPIIPANSVRNRVDITGVGLSGTTEIDDLAFSLYAVCELPVSINKFNLSTTLNIDSLPIGETSTKTFTRVFDRCSYEGTIQSTLELTGGGFAITIPNLFETPFGWTSNEEVEIFFDLDDIGDTYTTSEDLDIPTGTWASSTLFQSIEKVWKKKDDLEAMLPTSDQWVRAQVMDYLTGVQLERLTVSGTSTVDKRTLKLPEGYSIGDSNFNKVVDPDDIIIYAKQCYNACTPCSSLCGECECDSILKVRCVNGCYITLCEDAPDENEYVVYADFWNLNIETLGDKKLETKTNTSAYNYLGQISAYVAAWMLMDHVKVEAQNMDGVLAMIKESTNAKLFYSRMQFLVEGLHIPSGTSAICSKNSIDFNDF